MGSPKVSGSFCALPIGKSGKTEQPPKDTKNNIEPVVNTKLDNRKKIEILVDHGYSVEKAQEIITKHPELTTMQELTGFIHKNQPVTEEQNSESKNTNKTSSDQNFSFSDFSKADLKTKILTLADEYAKNLHIGNKKFENWDNLSPEEKVQAREDAIKEFINKYDKTNDAIDYKKLQEIIANLEKFSKLDDSKRKMYEDIIKSYMLDVQIANKNKIFIEDYYKQDSKVLTSDKYEFLQQLQRTDSESFENISSQDREFFDNETITIKAFESRFDEVNMTPTDVTVRINDFNASESDPAKKINKAVVVYDYLKAKNPEELSPEEKRLFDHYKKIADSEILHLNEVPDFDSTNKTFREMTKSEVFQNAVVEARKNNVNNPEHIAVKAYVESRLRSVEPKEREAIIKELVSGTSLSGREELAKVLDELLKDKTSLLHDANGNQMVSTITDVHDVVIRGENVDVEDYKLAHKNGVFDKKTKEDVSTFVTSAKVNAHKIDDAKKLGRFASSDVQYIVNSAKKAGVSDYELKILGDDYTDNYDLYTQDAKISRTKQHGYWYRNKADAIEAANKLQQKIIEHKDDPGIGDVYEAYGGSTSSYMSEAQVAVANNIMGMSEYFSDDYNIRAQSALANDIPNCNVENQAELHSVVMGSNYDEVLELASSNIHNYDENAQAGAIEATYATGNESAIRACESQLNQCLGVNASDYSYSQYVENKNVINTIQDAVNNLDFSSAEGQQKFLELVEKNGADVTKYLASCSEKEKANFVEKYCSMASESQLITFVKNNPSMCSLVMRYAKGLNKEKLFGAIYNGNKGEILKLLSQLDIKGNSVINLAKTYKDIAPDIALETQNSELATKIVKNPNEWGYNMGDSRTEKLNELASQNNIQAYNNSIKNIATDFENLPSLEFYSKKSGYLMG